MFQFDSTRKASSISNGDEDPRRCHWCNRLIDSDELIIVIAPRGHADEDASLIDEQPWHTVCYGMIQGAPSANDD